MNERRAKVATVVDGDEPVASPREGAMTVRSERGRLPIAKAYKMFVGGQFVRSESGRYFQVRGNVDSADPETVNVPRGSRKDVRDAVLTAKNAWDGWAA